MPKFYNLLLLLSNALPKRSEQGCKEAIMMTLNDSSIPVQGVKVHYCGR